MVVISFVIGKLDLYKYLGVNKVKWTIALNPCHAWMESGQNVHEENIPTKRYRSWDDTLMTTNWRCEKDSTKKN